MNNLNKKNPEIDIKNIKVQNQLLTTENKILNQRIKDLEDKLAYITGENINNNNNDNNNNYYNNSNGAENYNNTNSFSRVEFSAHGGSDLQDFHNFTRQRRVGKKSTRFTRSRE